MAYWRILLAHIAFWAIIPTAIASDKGWDRASTIGAGTLVGAALVLPVLHNDWDGGGQAVGSIAAAGLVSIELKKIFPETRPDGSDRRSFASTHSALAFSSAATIQNRYGWKVGVPAQFLAAFVGISRVKAHKHHWYDVGTGAAIGELAGFLITTKEDSKVRVVPWGDTKGGGIALAARF